MKKQILLLLSINLFILSNTRCIFVTKTTLLTSEHKTDNKISKLESYIANLNSEIFDLKNDNRLLWAVIASTMFGLILGKFEKMRMKIEKLSSQKKKLSYQEERKNEPSKSTENK
jgi:hypothetical protein